MNDRDEILVAIHKIMLEMFEIDAEKVTVEALLYEDLDFDSIDAVDMIVKLKELTQRELKLEDFKTARTVGDVVESIFRIMNP
ncbi:MAG: acyl carrier protein [Methylovulum sp.]|jgi:acyl carrier protein|nr:MAG: acyl carrier protein [Methylovulum sp.]